MGQIDYYRTRFFVEKRRETCLYSFFNLSLDEKRQLSSFGVGPDVNIKDKNSARKYAILLKDSGIIFEDVDKDTFIISFPPLISHNYLKLNLFPVRMIWEKPNFPGDVLWWHKNSSLSFKQAFVIAHFFTRKCKGCMRTTHGYFSSLPYNFTEVIDSVSKTKWSDSSLPIINMFKSKTMEKLKYTFNEIERIGESIE